MRKRLLMLAGSICLVISGCANGSSAETSIGIQTSAEQQTKDTLEETSENAAVETTEAVTEAETTEGVYILERPEGATEKYTVTAENARVSGKCKINGSGSEAYVDGLEENSDSMTFEVEIKNSYFYDIEVNAEGIGGEKTNNLAVDGEQVGTFTVDSNGNNKAVLSRVYLSEGKHEISVTKSWGWIKVYGMEFNMSSQIDASIYEVSSALVDRNADDSAKRLMSYLSDMYGKYIITGQYIDNGEIDAIFAETDKRPAIWGYDLGYYSSSSIAHGGSSATVQTMINLHKANPSIIFTLCWHWLTPDKYLLNTSSQPWYKGFRKEATNINLTAIMNGEDEEGYQLLLQDIDLISEQLKLLADAGVPILWRPLHEASGGWFWWGAEGADTYIKLYKLMYDRIVNVNGVHNLIWLWNGQSGDWYPGDEYVDIIGEDIYAGNQVSSSQASKYFEANAYTSANKMVVLSENGCIPDIDLCRRDGAMWGFFAVWNGEFIKKGTFAAEYSDEYTTKEILKKMYASEYAITLDEVPDLTTYTIH